MARSGPDLPERMKLGRARTPNNRSQASDPIPNTRQIRLRCRETRSREPTPKSRRRTNEQPSSCPGADLWSRPERSRRARAASLRAVKLPQRQSRRSGAPSKSPAHAVMSEGRKASKRGVRKKIAGSKGGSRELRKHRAGSASLDVFCGIPNIGGFVAIMTVPLSDDGTSLTALLSRARVLAPRLTKLPNSDS